MMQGDTRSQAWKTFIVLQTIPMWSMYFRYLRDFAPRMVPFGEN
jgi:hypothetical protein